MKVWRILSEFISKCGWFIIYEIIGIYLCGKIVTLEITINEDVYGFPIYIPMWCDKWLSFNWLISLSIFINIIVSQYFLPTFFFLFFQFFFLKIFFPKSSFLTLFQFFFKHFFPLIFLFVIFLPNSTCIRLTRMDRPLFVGELRRCETYSQCVSLAPPRVPLKLSVLHSIVFHTLLRGSAVLNTFVACSVICCHY